MGVDHRKLIHCHTKAAFNSIAYERAPLCSKRSNGQGGRVAAGIICQSLMAVSSPCEYAGAPLENRAIAAVAALKRKCSCAVAPCLCEGVCLWPCVSTGIEVKAVQAFDSKEHRIIHSSDFLSCKSKASPSAILVRCRRNRDLVLG